MRRLFMIAALIALALPALCDGTATLILWPGWTCSSTEDLSLGHKHTSFPLTYLFDDNPATPWVFSGTGKHEESGRSGYALHLSREEGRKPIAVDSIWIMNGYNKSQELFLRNNRIAELQLYVNSKLVKTVSLTDTMGWHKISVPRRPISDIYLRFTKSVKGRDNDVCVSEIALYDRDKKIDLKMPKAVEFTEGDVDCGDGQDFHLIDRTGKELESYDMESPCVWSPSGRYVAGADSGEFWVVDASTGKFITRRTLFKNNCYWAEVKKWHGDRSVDVSIEKNFPQKSKDPDDYKTIYSTKTIRITGK